MTAAANTHVDTRRRALISGLSGQDGSYLAELLLEKDYEVFGLVHGAPEDPLGCSEHLREQVTLINGDLLDPRSLTAAVAGTQSDELYHLAGPSFVPDSWVHPAKTFAAIAGATATLLEAVRDHTPRTRVFIASSAAMFGDPVEAPQREGTSFRPQSPYATGKLAAHQLAGQLRDHDGLFVCSGILYNHESERRPESFVSRRITSAAAQIKCGLATHVTLGDLEAVRDWSYAGDIVRAAWLTLQQDRPDDYILASGETHTVAQLARIAFTHVGLDPQEHVQVDPTLKRPAETKPLVGDPTRAHERLGWEPTLSFEQLVQHMVDADLRALQGAGR